MFIKINCHHISTTHITINVTGSSTLCVCVKEREREKERKRSSGLYHRHLVNGMDVTILTSLSSIYVTEGRL